MNHNLNEKCKNDTKFKEIIIQIWKCYLVVTKYIHKNNKNNKNNKKFKFIKKNYNKKQKNKKVKKCLPQNGGLLFDHLPLSRQVLTSEPKSSNFS